MYREDVLVKNIRGLINNKGLKQRSVAERAGIPINIFYSMTTGRKKIDSSFIPGIARALEVTPNELFGIYETPAS